MENNLVNSKENEKICLSEKFMDNTLSKRECELKFEIENDEKKEDIINNLNNYGFKFLSKNLETDYTPDVQGYICKKNGIILRFRIVDGEEHRILITLKVKKDTAEFQDNYEVEFYFDEFNEEKFNLINDILYKYIEIKLPKEICEKSSITEINELLVEIGFGEVRTFIQKIRSEYALNNVKITLDEFPQKIGNFLEIETNNKEDLGKTVDLLGFDINKAINKKYGKIIKEKQQDLPEGKRGICLFENDKVKMNVMTRNYFRMI